MEEINNTSIFILQEIAYHNLVGDFRYVLLLYYIKARMHCIQNTYQNALTMMYTYDII